MNECIAVNIQNMLKAIGEKEPLNLLSDVSLQLILLRNGYTITRKGSRRGENMPQALNEMLKRYVEDVHKIYGEKLRMVILYGSYARGDFRPDSDIDIMILVDLSDDEIRRKGHMLSNVTFDYNFDHNLEIMPIVKNLDHFNRWLRAYPFYNNVKNEGVELYAA